MALRLGDWRTGEMRGRQSASRYGLVAVSVILLAFAAAVLGVSSLYAQGATVVRVSPASQTINPGDSTSVDIVIDSVTNLYGADVRLSFDPAVLSVQDANPSQGGIQIEPGPLLTSGAGSYFAVLNTADNSAGTIKYALTQLNPSQPVSGSGVLATIQFVAIQPGTVNIQFTAATLADRNGNVIAETTEEGNITVVEIESPTATRTVTRTPQVEPSPTNSRTATATRTRTLTRTPQVEPSPTNSRTATATRTRTLTRTPQVEPSPTNSRTATATRTRTLTKTPQLEPSPTNTDTATRTATASKTATRTRTATASRTATATATRTVTPTPTSTGTRTITSTPTSTPTVCPSLGKPKLLHPKDGAKRNSRRAMLNWTDVPCAKFYKITVRQDSKQGKRVLWKRIPKSKYLITDLERGHTYYWRVRVKNSPKQKGPWSGWFSFTVNARKESRFEKDDRITLR